MSVKIDPEKGVQFNSYFALTLDLLDGFKNNIPLLEQLLDSSFVRLIKYDGYYHIVPPHPRFLLGLLSLRKYLKGYDFNDLRIQLDISVFRVLYNKLVVDGVRIINPAFALSYYLYSPMGKVLCLSKGTIGEWHPNKQVEVSTGVQSLIQKLYVPYDSCVPVYSAIDNMNMRETHVARAMARCSSSDVGSTLAKINKNCGFDVIMSNFGNPILIDITLFYLSDLGIDKVKLGLNLPDFCYMLFGFNDEEARLKLLSNDIGESVVERLVLKQFDTWFDNLPVFEKRERDIDEAEAAKSVCENMLQGKVGDATIGFLETGEIVSEKNVILSILRSKSFWLDKAGKIAFGNSDLKPDGDYMVLAANELLLNALFDYLKKIVDRYDLLYNWVYLMSKLLLVVLKLCQDKPDVIEEVREAQAIINEFAEDANLFSDYKYVDGVRCETGLEKLDVLVRVFALYFHSVGFAVTNKLPNREVRLQFVHRLLFPLDLDDEEIDEAIRNYIFLSFDLAEAATRTGLSYLFSLLNFPLDFEDRRSRVVIDFDESYVNKVVTIPDKDVQLFQKFEELVFDNCSASDESLVVLETEIKMFPACEQLLVTIQDSVSLDKCADDSSTLHSVEVETWVDSRDKVIDKFPDLSDIPDPRISPTNAKMLEIIGKFPEIKDSNNVVELSAAKCGMLSELSNELKSGSKVTAILSNKDKNFSSNIPMFHKANPNLARLYYKAVVSDYDIDKRGHLKAMSKYCDGSDLLIMDIPVQSDFKEIRKNYMVNEATGLRVHPMVSLDPKHLRRFKTSCRINQARWLVNKSLQYGGNLILKLQYFETYAQLLSFTCLSSQFRRWELLDLNNSKLGGTELYFVGTGYRKAITLGYHFDPDVIRIAVRKTVLSLKRFSNSVLTKTTKIKKRVIRKKVII